MMRYLVELSHIGISEHCQLCSGTEAALLVCSCGNAETKICTGCVSRHIIENPRTPHLIYNIPSTAPKLPVRNKAELAAELQRQVQETYQQATDLITAQILSIKQLLHSAVYDVVKNIDKSINRQYFAICRQLELHRAELAGVQDDPELFECELTRSLDPSKPLPQVFKLEIDRELPDVIKDTFGQISERLETYFTLKIDTNQDGAIMKTIKRHIPSIQISDHVPNSAKTLW